MKSLLVFLMLASASIAFAEESNVPTKEQIQATKKISKKDNLNNQPKPMAAQCWYDAEKKWYNAGAEV